MTLDDPPDEAARIAITAAGYDLPLITCDRDLADIEGLDAIVVYAERRPWRCRIRAL